MKGLFYNPSNRNNNTFSGWARGKGGNFYRRGGGNQTSRGNDRQSDSRGERILQIEFVQQDIIGLTYQGFFDPQLKDLIKALGYSKYDAERRAWLIPMNKKEEMVQAISEYCIESNVLLGEPPRFVENIISTPIPFGKVSKIAKEMKFDYASEMHSTNQKSIEDLPQKIKDTIYAFQKEGIQFGLQMFGRMLLGDEMGVGKTVQAIGIAYLYKNDWPLLIITPASLKFTWRDELLNWLPSLRPSDIQLFKKGSEPLNLDCCIFIMSYDLA